MLFSIDMHSQSVNKLTSISLYKIPLYKMYFFGLNISDVINMVNRGDTFTSKKLISDSNILFKLNNAVVHSKCIKSFLKGKNYCKPLKYSMDIRHVFMLTFSDSTKIYLGISSVDKLMMLNDKVYKKDKKLIQSLYFYFKSP